MKVKNKSFTRAISAFLGLAMALSLVAPAGAAEDVSQAELDTSGIVHEDDSGEVCSHDHLSYIDNGDGTHRAECDHCGEVTAEAALHDDAANCVCGYQAESDPDMPTEPTNDISGLSDKEIIEEARVACIHGKVYGESCPECGALAHSSKNIPLIGYDKEFFDQVNPDEDEGWLLYTIRLVCPHGTADGLYCKKCGHVVDNKPVDLPMCTILDSCLHGHVKGEKCEVCQKLKEDQGDYELAEGEAWDDPLIYAVDTMAFTSNVATMDGNGSLRCTWCNGRLVGDGINVQCHKTSNGYHWCKIARIEASGTCESHDIVWVYQCGHRIATNNSPFGYHHEGECTWSSVKNWHTNVLEAATCLSEGEVQEYYTTKCIHCDAVSPAQEMTTKIIPKLDHIITSCTYVDENNHHVECSGNGTSAHSFNGAHSFKQSGEDYQCTGCDASKTTVHVDVYTVDGELIKPDMYTCLVEVGHDGPTSVSTQDYLDKIVNAGHLCGIFPEQEQPDTASVQLGGVHLKYYGVLDKVAPTVSAVLENNIVTIRAFDDMSGLKEVRYFGEVTNVSAPLKFVGENNPDILYYSAKRIEDKGIYQIAAVDYAGNANVIDIEIGEETAPSKNFSIYVPTSITFEVNKDGTVATTPENPKIYNGNEIRAIRVTDIRVETTGDWKLVNYGTEFADADLDSKKIALSINGVAVSADGTVPMDPREWEIEADGQFALNLDISAPKQTSEQILTNVVRITFTADWADVPVQGRNKIIFTGGEHGKVDSETASVVLVTDVNGKLAKFPNAIPDSGYKFSHWENDNGEKVTTDTKFISDCIIYPVFIDKGKLTWVKAGLGGNNDRNRLAYGNGVIIALPGPHKSGQIHRSENGTSWSYIRGIEDGRWTAAYGKDKFVAVGAIYQEYTGKSAAYSKDGKTWTSVTIPNGWWSDVAYGNGVFVAVAYKADMYDTSGTTQAVYSKNGINWYKSTLPAAQNWTSVTYGDGKFVAVADSGNWAAYSTNGTTWTKCAMPLSAKWSDVTYGNGKFVAVASDRNKAVYSSDGVKWTVATLPSTSNRWAAVAAGEDMFIAINSDNGNYAYSFDGKSWMQSTFGTYGYYSDIIYGNGKFYALADDTDYWPFVVSTVVE